MLFRVINSLLGRRLVAVGTSVAEGFEGLPFFGRQAGVRVGLELRPGDGVVFALPQLILQLILEFIGAGFAFGGVLQIAGLGVGEKTGDEVFGQAGEFKGLAFTFDLIAEGAEAFGEVGVIEGLIEISVVPDAAGLEGFEALSDGIEGDVEGEAVGVEVRVGVGVETASATGLVV